MMKKFFIIGLLFMASACSVRRNNMPAINFANNPVVAHRGAYKQNGFPENSIASLQQAIHLKCTGSEFDVWMTADDSLVIHHDPDYNNLVIEKSSYDSLRKFPLSNGEKLPSLREYLLAGSTYNTTTRLVLEIKPSRISKERGLQLADNVVKLVNELHCAKLVVYISFDYDILKRVHAIEPSATTQYLNGDIAPSVLKANGINGADYNISVFRKNVAWIDEAKSNDIQLNAWTVDDSTDMRWLLDNKFDFITTNKPEMLFDMNKKKD